MEKILLQKTQYGSDREVYNVEVFLEEVAKDTGICCFHTIMTSESGSEYHDVIFLRNKQECETVIDFIRECMKDNLS